MVKNKRDRKAKKAQLTIFIILALAIIIVLILYYNLVYYFYMTGKLEKKFVENFAEAGQETSDLLGRQKAKDLMEDYYFEKSDLKGNMIRDTVQFIKKIPLI